MFYCMNYQVKPVAKKAVKKPVDSSSEEDSSSDEVSLFTKYLWLLVKYFLLVMNLHWVLF